LETDPNARTRWRFAISLAATLVATGGCDRGGSGEPPVASVGAYELGVDEVVDLLVDHERLSAQVDVIESLAELWIDYTLLAEAAARDSTFGQLDLEPLVRRRVEQTMIGQLRDSVIQVDTSMTQDELRDLYESRSPELRLRARHIMLTFPVGASQAQRDSVRAAMAELRRRIVAGESFEALAREHSQDPGSALSGGDLGYFGRGDMVLPFEEALLALEPGEVSDVVQTPMGLHLIRLEERRVPDFVEVAPEFRNSVRAQRFAEAESTFVAGLESRSAPELADGALEVTREMARAPGTQLSGRAARRPLVEWGGGAFTVGELQLVLRSEGAPLRDQVAGGTDEALTGFLRGLARRDMLVAEAVASGLEPPRARVDSMVADAAEQLRGAARALGLLELDRAPGEPLDQAVARAVEEALRRNLSGATQVVPLGLVGFQLRRGLPVTVSESGVGQAILQIGQVRAGRGASALEGTTDSAAQPPDTAGP
jgi:hypothetical protein